MSRRHTIEIALVAGVIMLVLCTPARAEGDGAAPPTATAGHRPPTSAERVAAPSWASMIAEEFVRDLIAHQRDSPDVGDIAVLMTSELRKQYFQESGEFKTGVVVFYFHGGIDYDRVDVRSATCDPDACEVIVKGGMSGPTTVGTFEILVALESATHLWRVAHFSFEHKRREQK